MLLQMCTAGNNNMILQMHTPRNNNMILQMHSMRLQDHIVVSGCVHLQNHVVVSSCAHLQEHIVKQGVSSRAQGSMSTCISHASVGSDRLGSERSINGLSVVVCASAGSRHKARHSEQAYRG